MIRTEKLNTYTEFKIGSFTAYDSERVRTYKHKQKAGRKGKGNRLARTQARLENIESEIQSTAIKYERAAKREAQKAKRKAKREAKRLNK